MKKPYLVTFAGEETIVWSHRASAAMSKAIQHWRAKRNEIDLQFSDGMLFGNIVRIGAKEARRWEKENLKKVLK
jgi:hypothetical protein